MLAAMPSRTDRSFLQTRALAKCAKMPTTNDKPTRAHICDDQQATDPVDDVLVQFKKSHTIPLDGGSCVFRSKHSRDDVNLPVSILISATKRYLEYDKRISEDQATTFQILRWLKYRHSRACPSYSYSCIVLVHHRRTLPWRLVPRLSGSMLLLHVLTTRSGTKPIYCRRKLPRQRPGK
jgi:hypothetical protein